MRGPRTALVAGIFLCLTVSLRLASAEQPTAEPSAVAGSAAAAPELLAAPAPMAATRVFVAWGGSYWAAEILARLDARRALIHYVGWGSEWDETVGIERLAYERGRSPKGGRVGEQLYVEWQGSYWAARVIGLSGPNVRVHYEGWGDEWDEIASPERLVRLRLDPSFANALAALRPGAAVEVLWGGSYWPARVTARVGADQFAIRYDGYGPEWDETVGPDRLRPR